MTPQFRPVADACVLVEFAGSPSPEVETAIRALDLALAQSPCPGLVEVIPAIVNLALRFDPVATTHAAVISHLRALLRRPPATFDAPAPALHEVAYRHDPAAAPDLAEVARQTGLTEDAVIAAHVAAEYRALMYGFAPGYAYLGGLPESLALNRKPAPKRDVPAGSVVIAGGQCLITALTMPTGWWIIGRTETRVLTGDPARPFLFAVGDRVRFRADD